MTDDDNLKTEENGAPGSVSAGDPSGAPEALGEKEKESPSAASAPENSTAEADHLGKNENASAGVALEKPEAESSEGSPSPFPILEKNPEEKPKKNPGDILTKALSLLSAWVQASRPAYFIVTLFPVLLGYVAAKSVTGESRPGMFFLILIASVLVHAAANMANDYFEDKAGVDGEDTLGGSRVLQEGKLTLGELKNGIIFCYLTAFILAIFIAGKNPLLWIMVIFAAFSSLFYVAPPIKYGHRALGELMVFLNMGVIMVVGTYTALTGQPNRGITALSIPPAFMVAGILFFQSLPEIREDREAGKVTLAGLLGKEGASLVYLLWWPLVWLLVFNLYLTGHLGGSSMLWVLAVPLHILVYLKIVRAADWTKLDKDGWLVKVVYLVTALSILLGAAFKPLPAV
ncbi:MAG: prenyltransferase [Deltaproteobacteria bacterium]|jgi:1,4-dihydroxy-2-naphthoate octaprenyltransferase|nr:prenyltransferase [Deltaproteobacteria bacterium]